MSQKPPSLADVVLQGVAIRTGRRVRDLVVEVGPDRVTIRGRAGSFHVKQLAQQGVQEVLPNALLENAIVVD